MIMDHPALVIRKKRKHPECHRVIVNPDRPRSRWSFWDGRGRFIGKGQPEVVGKLPEPVTMALQGLYWALVWLPHGSASGISIWCPIIDLHRTFTTSGHREDIQEWRDMCLDELYEHGLPWSVHF
jgi:hypothetical protein